MVFVGTMGIINAFLILAFYSVVAGWTIEYVFLAVKGSLSGSPDNINRIFEEFKASHFWPYFWTVVFLIMTALIIVGGVKNGIEKYTKY